MVCWSGIETMVKRLLSVIVCAALAVSAAPVSAKDWVTFEPVSSWNMDYAENSCALKRVFNHGADDTILFVIRQYPGTSAVELTFGRKKNILRRSKGDEPYVAFLPLEQEPVKRKAHRLIFDEGFFGFQISQHLRTIDDEDDEALEDMTETEKASYFKSRVTLNHQREEEITSLMVRDGFTDNIVLQTGSLGKPMEAMRECLDNLREHWGLGDTDDIATQAEPVEMKRWVRKMVNNYPVSAVNSGQQGPVPIALIVGTDGRPERCIVPFSPAAETLEEAACSTLKKHARFKPALDTSGQPVRSLWQTKVVFALF